MTSITLSQRDDGIAVLTFDQPGSKANVLSPAMWSDLAEALKQVDSFRSLSGLILCSAKPGIFIAGADLNVIRAAKAPYDRGVQELIEQGLRVLETLEEFPVPTIAVIDGAALGGGLEVALACDFRLAGNHPKCKLGLPEVNLGLIPGWGGTQRLSRILGLPAAAEMLSTGQPIDAEKARHAVLAEPVVPGDSILDDAARVLFESDYEQAREIKLAPIPQEEIARFQPPIADRPTAVRTALQIMMDGATKTLYDAIALETDAFLRLAGSEESRPLIEAFFNRPGK